MVLTLFPLHDHLNEAETQQALRLIVRENLAFQVMATLTGGVFVVALLNELGASNFTIGLLAAVGPLAQLIQIPAISIVERIRNRRLIVVAASAAARSIWLLMALIPFFVSPQIAATLILLGIGLYSAFAAISNCSWSSWMRDVIPQDTMGAFFSRRMILSGILGMVLSLATSLFVDSWERFFPDATRLEYSVLFVVGGVIGLLGLYFFTARIPEPRMVSKNEDIRHSLRRPFQDMNFRNLLIFDGTWNFAINLAAPFFTVYMLQWLGLDLLSITILTTLSQIVNIVVLRAWGQLIDRFSNKSVLNVCALLFILCIFGWTFTTLPERHVLTVPLLIVIHLVSGLSTAGVALATGNMGLKLAPRGEATPYLATRSLVNSIAATVAPIIGGQFADFFRNRELTLSLTWSDPRGTVTFNTLDFQYWDFFFFFAMAIGLFAVYRLAFVNEQGDVSRRTIIQQFATEIRFEFRRGMRNFSSIGGLYQSVWFPFARLLTTRTSPPEKEDT
jgi:MFS family permease